MRAIGFTVGLCITCSVLFAQDLSISGTVQDSWGVIPNALVTLRDPAGTTTKATSDNAGQYSFTNLRSGTYEVGVSRDGYEPQTRTLTLTSASGQTDVTLQAAGGSSSIDVDDVVGRGTASGTNIPNDEIPNYVATVTERELRDQGINDLPHALLNVSGVTTQVQYGVYEWYTVSGITQQSGTDFLYVDGLTLTGNRPQTQLNNVQEVQILKGPNSLLYGGAGAGQGGIINIIRKKPSAIRSNEVTYRVGAWGLEQAGWATTGKVFGVDKLLYRGDFSYAYSSGWRQNTTNRLTGAPELTWLINSKMSLTAIETFARDRYSLDAGVPAAMIAIPNFPLDRKLNAAQDFQLFRDWQNEIDYRWTVNGHITVGSTFFKRMNRDQYDDGETESYNATTGMMTRGILYYEHNRRPTQEITDFSADYKIFGMRHRFLARYNFQDQYNFEPRTGDAPGVVNSNLLPLPPVPVAAFIAGTWVDTAPTYNSFPVTQIQYSDNRFNTVALQDQITPVRWLALNFAASDPFYHRWARNDNYNNDVFVSRGTETTLSNSTRLNTRVGAVLLPMESWGPVLRSLQFYFSHNQSFNPVTQIPLNGATLSPVINKSWETGARWRGFHNRFDAQLAARRIEDQNRVVTISTGVYDQVGKASTYNIDFDSKGDLSRGFFLIANYAYADNLIDRLRTDGLPQTNGGKRFPDAPKHLSRIMVNKTIHLGSTTRLNIGLGGHYVRHYYTNTANTLIVPSVTTFDGAISLQRQHYDIQANIENLTDVHRYFVSVINSSQLYPGMPISATLTLRYRF